MILGGSPIKVAAPPTLDASTIAITKGMGDSLIDLNTDSYRYHHKDRSHIVYEHRYGSSKNAK